jgi:FixJ family two-component response regulator
MTDNRLPITDLHPRVFVIDDDASVRKSLTRLLHSYGFEVESFASAEYFLQREPFEEIGCIILDIRMPGMSGMVLQEKLSHINNVLPIIFITGHGDIPTSVQAMKKGAIDFLTKPFDDKGLLQAIQSAIEKNIKAKADQEEVHRAVKLIHQLTTREREILSYIIAGLLNKQIGFKLGIAEKTIKVHRSHIMEKLQVSSVADLVRLSEKAGIKPSDKY